MASLLSSTGLAGWLVLASLVAALVVQLGFTLLAHRGWRIPAAVWLLPALIVYGIGWLGAWRIGHVAQVGLATAPPADLVTFGTRGVIDLIRADALGLYTTAVALLVTAWVSAVGHVAGAGPKARTVAWHPIPALGLAVAGAVLVIGLGVSLGVTGTGFTLGMLLFLGLAPLALVSAWRSRDRTTDGRLGAARALVATASFLAIVAVGVASAGLTHAAGLEEALGLALDERPFVVARSLEDSRSVAGLGLLASGLTVVAGGLSVLLAPLALGSWRSVFGAWLVAALFIGAGAGRGLRTYRLLPLASVPGGGAIARQPDVRLADLPNPRDLSGLARVDDGIIGTCLVMEGGSGWEGEPLYAGMDQVAQIAAHGTAEVPVPELERTPGCPDTLAPLPGPFSTFEVPVVAVPGNRLAPAVTGYRWFLREGTLRILLSPEVLVPAEEPPRVGSWRHRTVPIHWEMPPEDERVGDGDDRWDYEGAATLPVTVMEARAPVLIAGGSREILSGGDEGAERLRDALSGAEVRDLVLVPRKHWTVQDLVDFCLTVLDDVEGARCVVRPENPDRWSERTGLPLPWTVPAEE